MPWLPADFVHPLRVDIGPDHHVRPIRATDVDLDMVAVMSSQARLWSIFGPAWGWPPADLSRQQDWTDLARHEAEIEAHESFNYALLDNPETALLGCIYIDPPEKVGADAEISWWVADEVVGSALDRTFDAFVPGWIADAWPFVSPRHIGRDISWENWIALPEVSNSG